MIDPNRQPPPSDGSSSIELVLGAGGIKGFGHIGLLKAIAELKVKVGKITGVSVGSIVAAFYTNGYTPDQIFEIFYEGVLRRWDPSMLLGCMSWPDPLSLAIGGWIDLRPSLEEMTTRYNLRPNDRLRIVSCDILRQDPVQFEGSDYSLSTAIAASCSPPGVFRPVWHRKSDGTQALLVDGAWYHYNPTDFCKSTAIVSTFRPATEGPKEWQLPIDLYYHWREIYLPIAPHRNFVDPDKNVVVEIGLPDVAGLNFGLSREKCLEMVEDGYRTGLAVLKKALADGRIEAES